MTVPPMGRSRSFERYLGRGVVGVERRPDVVNGDADSFDLERTLLRKAELAHELDADWFINHDADEFREAPWPGTSLNAAIQRVDGLGFNAIDFACLEFRPDHDRFRPGEDVREAFQYYAAAAPYDRVQVRCWKKGENVVDLAASGGHDVGFPRPEGLPDSLHPSPLSDSRPGAWTTKGLSGATSSFSRT